MIESVAVRQRGAFDFETHYHDLCALQNSCPLPSVKAHLSEGVVDINGDRIRATDWVPILNSLRINKTLEFVAVRSYYQQALEEADKSYGGAGSIKRKTPAIRSKEITYRLCKALKECLCVTPNLTCIELQGLPLRDRDLAALAKGLSKNGTVQHLSLEYCPVGDEGLEIICKGVKNSPCVTSLNLTACALTWKGADTLAKIIKHQAMKRHNEAWQDSLRYRRPDLDRMAGIRRITVNSNPLLGDQGATAFAEALKDDLWLKALDMQQCGMSSAGAKALLDVLKYNTTIVVLDVRQNPMIDQEVIRSIMEQVMINCNGQDTQYKWIKAEPPQDPSKVKAKKKKLKTLQSSFGKKTTIKVPDRLGRRRSRSTGSVSRPLQPFNPDNIKPGPGMPWRTALRAHRYRGYPPEHTPGKASAFEQMSSDFSSPSSSPKHGASVLIDYSAASIDDTTATSRVGISDSEIELGSFRKVKIELEQMRRRFREESRARAKAEERVLELTVDNRRLRQEVSTLRSHGSGLLDDDKVLESIEDSFKQFHAFLDLLRDAGLGQLITLAGLDQSTMPFGRSFMEGDSLETSGVPPKENLPRPMPFQPGRIDISHPSLDESHPELKPSRLEQVATYPHENGQISAPPGQGKLVHSNILPQNYGDDQDPTMQNPIITDKVAESQFDELYHKVLLETEGVLSQAKGDADNILSVTAKQHVGLKNGLPEGTNTAVNGLHPKVNIAQEDAANLSDQSQKSVFSEKSLPSQKSQVSSHSIRSHQSQPSARSYHSHRSVNSSRHSESRSASGSHNILSDPPANRVVSYKSEEHDYSENFEKSEEISEIDEDLDVPNNSPSKIDDSDNEDF